MLRDSLRPRVVEKPAGFIGGTEMGGTAVLARVVWARRYTGGSHGGCGSSDAALPDGKVMVIVGCGSAEWLNGTAYTSHWNDYQDTFVDHLVAEPH